MSRRAKTLTDHQLNELLQCVAAESNDPLRDYAIVLLSFKAGLRAAEISGLSWSDVTDAAGKVGIPVTLSDGTVELCLSVPRQIAKKGHARDIPIHPGLMPVLEALAAREMKVGGRPRGRVIKGCYSESISPNALQRYMGRLYRRHGLEASSHSGRRTMITKAAQGANAVQCSLRDVQRIAGHKFIDTTERYVEASPNIGKLIRSI